MPKKRKDLRLNLACGQIKEDGWFGVDIAKTPVTDMVFDLRKPKWPWATGSVSEIVCSHFFEHLTGKERIRFMDEAWRILKPEGKFSITVPYWSSMRAIQDPTHEWPPVCEASFLYFNKKWREDNKLDHYNIKSDFDYTYGYSIHPQWIPRNDETKQFAVANYINAVADLQVTLTKRV